MNHYTELVVIIDRSGSMANRTNDSVGGFNHFLRTQKELPGDAKLTVVIFDDHYDVLVNAIDLKEAREITASQIQARGGTALLDAIGRTINDVQRRLDSLMSMDRTNKVLFTIITDGEENQSREFTKSTIKAMIERQTALGWKFDFLSADMNAINEAQSYGIQAANTMFFSNTAKGWNHSYDTVSSSAMMYRSGQSFSIKDEQGKEDQK